MNTHHTPDALVEAVARTLAQRVAGTIGRDADEYWQDVGASFVDDARAALDASAVPELLEALKEARATLATALKSTAPDWFVTEEDVKEHLSIKKMDTAIAKATGGTA